MSMYARSDVMSVAISPAMGGCGATHTRPVTRGAPVRDWELKCEKCCAHLSGANRPKTLVNHPGNRDLGIPGRQEWVADADPQWSRTRDSAPLTPDERRQDASFRETAAQQINAINALGTARANGLQIPDEMFYLLSRQLPTETMAGIHGTSAEPKVLCPKEHENAAGAKFCAECGISMISEPADELPQVKPLEEVLPLHNLHIATLRKMAREKDLSDKGTKEDLIKRLNS